MTEDEGVSVAPPRPKKPFLRRGEGTERRVYASRYRDVAREKRLEIQKLAKERNAERDNPSTAIERNDTPTKAISPSATETLVFEPATKNSPFECFPSETLVAPNVESTPTKFNPFAENAFVDGSCRIESADAADPVRLGGSVDASGSRLNRAREEAWLERQRRHEEEQWIESMELKEFEQLEKQIVEDTRDRLNAAECEMRKKQVTFQDRPIASPSHSKSFRSDLNTRLDTQQPTAPSLSPKNVQKLKSISASRSKKLTSSSTKSSVKSQPTRQPASTRSAKTVTSKPLVVDRDLVVDSTFLDRLLEKDFNAGHTQSSLDDTHPTEDLFAERLRLQSIQDDFENEKREWQRKQQESTVQFEAMKSEELKKIKRERRVLEQQSKALLKLPNKKERSEIESLEALLETERKEARSREARHKLTVERLKDQIQQLQIHSQELQEEVKSYEERQLMKLDSKNAPSRSTMTSPPLRFDIGIQADFIEMETSCDQRPFFRDQPNPCFTDNAGRCSGVPLRDKWAVQLENPFYSEVSVDDPQAAPDLPPIAPLPAPGFQGGHHGHAPPVHAPWMAAPFTHPDSSRDAIRFPSARQSGSSSWQIGYNAPVSGSFDFTRSLPREIPPFGAIQQTHCASVPPFNLHPSQPPYTHSDLMVPTWQHPSYISPAPPSMPRPDPRSGICYGGDPSHLQNSRFLHEPRFESRESTLHPRISSTPPERNDARVRDISDPDVEIDPAINEHGNQPSTSRTSGAVVNVNRRSTPSQEHRSEIAIPNSARDRPSGSSPRGSTQRDARLKAPTPDVSHFDNGTIKQSYQDGRVVVWFANADVKHVYPCGRVEYFYADLSTWQVTHTSNVDIFYFDIGQVEAHKANGDKDIIFPDGSVRTVHADGSTENAPIADSQSGSVSRTENEVTMDDVVPELRCPKPEIPPNRPERTTAKKPIRH